MFKKNSLRNINFSAPEGVMMYQVRLQIRPPPPGSDLGVRNAMPMSVVYTNFGGELVHENRGGTETTYISDPLGSVIDCRNSAGTQVFSATYWPYGEIRTSSGTNPSQFDFVGALGYYRENANRAYVRARFLRKELARWMNVDPLWPGEDAYGYVRSMPPSANDPSGLVAPVIYVGVLLILALVLDGDEKRCRCMTRRERARYGNMLVSISACGLAALVPGIRDVTMCRGLKQDEDAFGVTDSWGNVSFDDGFFGRPKWDSIETAIHEGLHSFCGIMNSEPEHTILGDWATFLMERCKRCPGELRDVNRICTFIRNRVSPPTYIGPCKGHGGPGWRIG